MDLSERIDRLKQWHHAIKTTDWSPNFPRIHQSNPWFTSEFVTQSIQGISHLTEPANLDQWLGRYRPTEGTPKTVGLVMAGNIPAVGFHDLFCLLVAGHKGRIKLSRQDNVIIPMLYDRLLEIDARFSRLVTFTDKMAAEEIQAVIATGSDNTARYVRFQFQGLPCIIRKNRTAHAVLHGNESAEDLALLGVDLFSYFGRGCRNVSKIWTPPNCDLNPLIQANNRYSSLLKHTKYANNLKYQRALLTTQSSSIVDAGYALFCDDHQPVSPLAVVYKGEYTHKEDLSEKLYHIQDKLQCVLSAGGWYEGSVSFGRSQLPNLWDFADGIDTLEFLWNL